MNYEGVNFGRNSSFTNQFQASHLKNYKRSALEAGNYIYGNGGNIQPFNNIQGYQTGQVHDYILGQGSQSTSQPSSSWKTTPGAPGAGPNDNLGHGVQLSHQLQGLLSEQFSPQQLGAPMKYSQQELHPDKLLPANHHQNSQGLALQNYRGIPAPLPGTTDYYPRPSPNYGQYNMPQEQQPQSQPFYPQDPQAQQMMGQYQPAAGAQQPLSQPYGDGQQPGGQAYGTQPFTELQGRPEQPGQAQADPLQYPQQLPMTSEDPRRRQLPQIQVEPLDGQDPYFTSAPVGQQYDAMGALNGGGSIGVPPGGLADQGGNPASLGALGGQPATQLNEDEVKKKNYHYASQTPSAADKNLQAAMQNIESLNQADQQQAQQSVVSPRFAQGQAQHPPQEGVTDPDTYLQQQSQQQAGAPTTPVNMGKKTPNEMQPSNQLVDSISKLDHKLTQNKWKNRDHFHMVKVKDIYEILEKNKEKQAKEGAHPTFQPQLDDMTKTIYSEDSNHAGQLKNKKAMYAEILVEQIKEKRQQKLKEKAERASLAIDIETKAKPRVKVPEIPRLLRRAHSEVELKENISYAKSVLDDRNISPQERDEIIKRDFGFFDKFYGPERKMREQYIQAKVREMRLHQSNQILERQYEKITGKEKKFFKDHRQSSLPPPTEQKDEKPQYPVPPFDQDPSGSSQFPPPSKIHHEGGPPPPWYPYPPPPEYYWNYYGYSYPPPPGYSGPSGPAGAAGPGQDPSRPTTGLTTPPPGFPFWPPPAGFPQWPPPGQPNSFGQPPAGGGADPSVAIPGQPSKPPSENFFPQFLDGSVTNRGSIIDPTQRVGAAFQNKQQSPNHPRSISPPEIFPGDTPSGAAQQSTPPLPHGGGGISTEEALMRASKASQLYQHLNQSRSAHKQRKHLNEHSMLPHVLNKDRYKDDLMKQIQEKQDRQLKEKQKKIVEEMMEERRIKREIEEMNKFHEDHRSDQEESPRPPPDFNFANAEVPHEEKKVGSMSMASKLITESINPRKVLNDKKALRDASKPLKFDDKGKMVPPSQEELELQLAIENNMEQFNSSIAQMRANHTTLIKQYNQQIVDLQKKKFNSIEDANTVQNEALQFQILTLQQEIDKIIQVIERTGGSVLTNSKTLIARPLPDGTPNLAKPPLPSSAATAAAAGGGLPPPAPTNADLGPVVNEAWVKPSPMEDAENHLKKLKDQLPAPSTAVPNLTITEIPSSLPQQEGLSRSSQKSLSKQPGSGNLVLGTPTQFGDPNAGAGQPTAEIVNDPMEQPLPASGQKAPPMYELPQDNSLGDEIPVSQRDKDKIVVDLNTQMAPAAEAATEAAVQLTGELQDNLAELKSIRDSIQAANRAVTSQLGEMPLGSQRGLQPLRTLSAAGGSGGGIQVQDQLIEQQQRLSKQGSSRGDLPPLSNQKSMKSLGQMPPGTTQPPLLMASVTPVPPRSSTVPPTLLEGDIQAVIKSAREEAKEQPITLSRKNSMTVLSRKSTQLPPLPVQQLKTMATAGAELSRRSKDQIVVDLSGGPRASINAAEYSNIKPVLSGGNGMPNSGKGSGYQLPMDDFGQSGEDAPLDPLATSELPAASQPVPLNEPMPEGLQNATFKAPDFPVAAQMPLIEQPTTTPPGEVPSPFTNESLAPQVPQGRQPVKESATLEPAAQSQQLLEGAPTLRDPHIGNTEEEQPLDTSQLPASSQQVPIDAHQLSSGQQTTAILGEPPLEATAEPSMTQPNLPSASDQLHHEQQQLQLGSPLQGEPTPTPAYPLGQEGQAPDLPPSTGILDPGMIIKPREQEIEAQNSSVQAAITQAVERVHGVINTVETKQEAAAREINANLRQQLDDIGGDPTVTATSLEQQTTFEAPPTDEQIRPHLLGTQQSLGMPVLQQSEIHDPLAQTTQPGQPTQFPQQYEVTSSQPTGQENPFVDDLEATRLKLQQLKDQKAQNMEPIVIKSLHSSSTKPQAPPQYAQPEPTGEKILVENEFDNRIFEQRSILRDQVKQTNMTGSLVSNDLINGREARLYTEDQVQTTVTGPRFQEGEKTQPFAEKLDNTLNRLHRKIPPRPPISESQAQTLGMEHLYKNNNEVEEIKKNPPHQDESTSKQQTSQFRSLSALRDSADAKPINESANNQASETINSLNTAGVEVLTQDSQINERTKKLSFYKKQKQLQDAAYLKQGQMFGCYGPIKEESKDEETKFINQNPLKYSRRDPFGVNMRLRQSLSSTNMILFKHDKDRYITSCEKIENKKQKLLPQNAYEQFQDLNLQAVEHNEEEDLKYDPNYFKDEVENPAPVAPVHQQQVDQLVNFSKQNMELFRIDIGAPDNVKFEGNPDFVFRDFDASPQLEPVIEAGSEVEVELLPENYEEDLRQAVTPTAVMSQVIQTGNPKDSIAEGNVQARMARSQIDGAQEGQQEGGTVIAEDEKQILNELIEEQLNLKQAIETVTSIPSTSKNVEAPGGVSEQPIVIHEIPEVPEPPENEVTQAQAQGNKEALEGNPSITTDLQMEGGGQSIRLKQSAVTSKAVALGLVTEGSADIQGEGRPPIVRLNSKIEGEILGE